RRFHGHNLPAAFSARQHLEPDAFIAQARGHADFRQRGQIAESANSPARKRPGNFFGWRKQRNRQAGQEFGFVAFWNDADPSKSTGRMKCSIGVGGDGNIHRRAGPAYNRMRNIVYRAKQMAEAIDVQDYRVSIGLFHLWRELPGAVEQRLANTMRMDARKHGITSMCGIQKPRSPDASACGVRVQMPRRAEVENSQARPTTSLACAYTRAPAMRTG